MNYKNKYSGLFIAILVIIVATGVTFAGLDAAIDPVEVDEDALANGDGMSIMEQPEDLFDGKEPVQKPNIFMISISVGVLMGVISFSAYQGGKQLQDDSKTDDAAGLLFEEGLENMTVKDSIIVRKLMDMKEFTIPDLVEGSPVSRSSVWRLVKRLNEKGLVEEKENSEISDGTRGKPRKVFKFLGRAD